MLAAVRSLRSGPMWKQAAARIRGHVAADLQFHQFAGQGERLVQEGRVRRGLVQVDGRVKRIAAFQGRAAVIPVEVAYQPVVKLGDDFGPVGPRAKRPDR